MERRGLLYGRMGIAAAREAEFNRWYDSVYQPTRLDHVRGFLFGRRLRAIDAHPKYAALYDLQSPAVLQTPEYLSVIADEHDHPTSPTWALKQEWQDFQRSVYEQISEGTGASYRPPNVGSIVVIEALLPLNEDNDSEFNEWYDSERLPQLSEERTVLSARRFKAVDGSPRYLAIYDFPARTERFPELLINAKSWEGHAVQDPYRRMTYEVITIRTGI
jgi:hypothetical protein